LHYPSELLTSVQKLPPANDEFEEEEEEEEPTEAAGDSQEELKKDSISDEVLQR
jgi:hypothetical protein